MPHVGLLLPLPQLAIGHIVTGVVQPWNLRCFELHL